MPTPAKSPSTPPGSPSGQEAADRRRRVVQRRRAVALGVLAVVLLVASIGVGGGGGSAHRRLRAHAARPSPERMHAIADAARRRKAAEDRAIDRVLAYTPFVTSGGGRRREVALTFDDGPGPYTPGVLRVLRRFHAKATFFEVGFMERWFHSSTTKAVAEGHAIGDHTESHPRLAGLPRPEQRTQIVSQAEWLGKLGVPRPRLFRPPFGSFDPRTFRILHNQRMLMVLWSVDTGDFSQPGARTIVRRALAGAKPGAIILMHDAGGARSETVAALRELIPALRKRHLDLVTVPQLMLDDPPPHGQRLPHYLSGG